MKYRDMTVDVPESMRRLLFEGCEAPKIDEDAAQMNPDGSIGRQGGGSNFYKKCQGAAEARMTYAGPETCAQFGWSRKNWIDISMKEIAKAVKAFRAESATSEKGNLKYLRFKFSDGGDMLIVPARLHDRGGKEIVVMKFVKASQIKGTFFNPTDEFCDGRKHPGNGAFLSDMKAAKMKLTDFQDLVVEDTGHYLYPAKLSQEKKPDSVEIVVSYKPYKGSPSPVAAKEGPFVDELYQYMLNSDKPATSVVQVADKVNEIQKVM